VSQDPNILFLSAWEHQWVPEVEEKGERQEGQDFWVGWRYQHMGDDVLSLSVGGSACVRAWVCMVFIVLRW
jgi:hypothetical protein